MRPPPSHTGAGVARISPIDWAKESVEAVQQYWQLTSAAVGDVFRRPFYLADLLLQADSIGVGSLPIVLLTGFFTGAVLALQSANSMERFGALSKTGYLVALSMVRELGPVLTGLMVAGRNASGMASEIGSMKVTEQIDAMRALGADPIKKLVTPRLISSVVMLFFLTILSDFIGLAGGAMICAGLLHLDLMQYWTSAWQALGHPDLVMGLSKPLYFGFIIATVGCHYGMSAKGGTQGVGRATTQAVVASSVLIVLGDLVITQLLMKIYPVN